MVYSYSSENRIINRCSYMYTPFEGEDFFEQFYSARKKCLFQLEEEILHFQELTRFSKDIFRKGIERLFDLSKNVDVNVISRIDVMTITGKLKKKFDSFNSGDDVTNDIPRTSYGKNPFDIKDSEDIDTMELLYILFRSIDDNSAEGNMFRIKWLNKLIQRFEVTKRLYENYMPGFRKGTGAYDKDTHYCFFAFSVSSYCCTENNLKYLNTLLE